MMLRRIALIMSGVIGLYLVAGGIVELAVIDYANPASYRQDWGGPSLAGVLAVHVGPALLTIAAAVYLLRRRHRTLHADTR